MIEKFPGNIEGSDLEKEEGPPEDKLAGASHVQNERHADSLKPANDSGRIFPETTGGIDVWSEYLLRTGNPMMESVKHMPIPEFNRKTGMFETDPKAFDAWKKSMEGGTTVIGEIMRDMTRSEHLLKDVRLTGDVPADALQLCRSIGAQRGEQRLLNGEDPREVLQGYADIADQMVESSKQNASLRKVAYTAIEIRRAVEQILNQPMRKP